MANRSDQLLNQTITNLTILSENFQAVSDNNNAFFLVTMGIIVFVMQFGFAFLEAGSVRSKNTTNILTKNLLDSCISSIAYFFTGWAFAYGTHSNPFCGFGQFLLIGLDAKQFPLWFFQFVFAAATPTIVSGALAERCEIIAYLLYSALLTGFVYPVITHWAWDDGWLANGPLLLNGEHVRFQDFAGAGVVHLHGGSVALIGAIILGPRIGRFEDKKAGTPAIPLKGHSTPFVAMGGIVLMFGFFAFNGGSRLSISVQGDGEAVGRAVTNTMLCGGWAAIAVLTVYKLFIGKWSLVFSVNAALAGMVSACAGCDLLEPWACSVIGIGSGLSFFLLSQLIPKLHIDDPVDAVAVHFGGGLWGILITPIMMHHGIIYNANRDAFLQLGWNLVGAAAIIGWSMIVMGILFFLLRAFGLFRVPKEIELKGLDIHIHGETAYPRSAYGHGWFSHEPQDDHMSFSTDYSYVQHRNGHFGSGNAVHFAKSVRERDFERKGDFTEGDQLKGEHVHVWTHAHKDKQPIYSNLRSDHSYSPRTYRRPTSSASLGNYSNSRADYSSRYFGEKPENIHHARRRQIESSQVHPIDKYQRRVMSYPEWNEKIDDQGILHV